MSEKPFTLTPGNIPMLEKEEENGSFPSVRRGEEEGVDIAVPFIYLFMKRKKRKLWLLKGEKKKKLE